MEPKLSYRNCVCPNWPQDLDQDYMAAYYGEPFHYCPWCQAYLGQYVFERGAVDAPDPNGGHKRFAEVIVSEASIDLSWHRSKIRVAKTPRFSLPLAQYILRTAREAGMQTEKNTDG